MSGAGRSGRDASAPLRRDRLSARAVAAGRRVVANISGGRLELGVGGGDERGHEWAGVDPWSPSERSTRLRWFVEELDELVRGDDRRGLPVQRPRPPLTIAAWEPTSLPLAAERADRWNTVGGRSLTPDEGLARSREHNVLLDSYCSAARRDKSEIARSLLVGYGWIARLRSGLRRRSDPSSRGTAKRESRSSSSTTRRTSSIGRGRSSEGCSSTSAATASSMSYVRHERCT
jgi:hypothetical protein